MVPTQTKSTGDCKTDQLNYCWDSRYAKGTETLLQVVWARDGDRMYYSICRLCALNCLVKTAATD